MSEVDGEVVPPILSAPEISTYVREGTIPLPVSLSHEALRSRERELTDALAALTEWYYGERTGSALDVWVQLADLMAAARALLVAEPEKCPTCDADDPDKPQGTCEYPSISDAWHRVGSPVPTEKVFRVVEQPQ